MLAYGMTVAALLLSSPPANANFTHRGFNVTMAPAGPTPLAQGTANALIEQIEIVEGSGVPPDVLAFFKTVVIVVDAELKSQPGIFFAKDRIGYIHLQPAALSRKRPILLHELLHAYHFFELSLRNAEIQDAYAIARADVENNRQYKNAHFLDNPKEFFAVTASIYLSGEVQQPPFDCSGLARKYPAYMLFLERKFGKRSCN